MKKIISLFYYIFISLSGMAQTHNRTITIAAVGDIMLGSAYPSKNNLPFDVVK